MGNNGENGIGLEQKKLHHPGEVCLLSCISIGSHEPVYPLFTGFAKISQMPRFLGKLVARKAEIIKAFADTEQRGEIEKDFLDAVKKAETPIEIVAALNKLGSFIKGGKVRYSADEVFRLGRAVGGYFPKEKGLAETATAVSLQLV